MIERYVEWLREDRDLVAERIRAAIRAETPVYASFPDEEAEASWAAGIDRSLAMFVSGVAHGRGRTAEERATMEAIGRDRAEQGFPLDAVVASIAVAARVVHDWVLIRADRPLSATELGALLELSGRLTTFANEITAAALHAYLARREALATTVEQARARLFHDVLSGRAGHDDAVTARAAALDCDLSVPWAAALVPLATGVDSVEDELLVSLAGAEQVPMATAAVPHTAIAFSAPPQTWAAVRRTLEGVAHTHGATVLLVGPCADPATLHRRYTRAQVLVPHLHRLADGAGLLDADELREVALLAAAPAATRQAFVEDILGPVEQQPRGRAAKLLRTLEALLAHDNSVKGAATALACNPKTVRAHAREIEALTRYSLDRLLHLRWLGTALVLRSLQYPDRQPIG